MRKKAWVTTAVGLLIIAAADFAYWRFAAEQLRFGFQDWAAARADEGWDVRYGTLSIGGWPRDAEVDVPNLTLRHTGGGAVGDVEVALATATLTASLLSPATLRIAASGPAHVRIGELPDVVLTSDADWLSVPLRSSGESSANLHVSGLRIEPASAPWHATVGLLNGQASVPQVAGQNNQPAATLSLGAEAIALPTVVKWPLGTNISSLSLNGALNHMPPPSNSLADTAKVWRDNGGSLAISHFALGWGPLGLTSSATLALDDQLQPMGSGSARFVGFSAALDRLATGGVLSRSAATAAKAVLSLMAGAGDAEEPSSVEVPLTLQYRTLSMRQLPLVRLPELDWSGR